MEPKVGIYADYILILSMIEQLFALEVDEEITQKKINSIKLETWSRVFINCQNLKGLCSSRNSRLMKIKTVFPFPFRKERQL